MKVCDLCMHPTVDVTELRDCFKSDGIEEVCESCCNWANQEKLRLISTLRESLIERKGMLPPPPQRKPWYRRIFP